MIFAVKFRQDWRLKASTGPPGVFGVADENAAVLRVVADFDAVAAARAGVKPAKRVLITLRG